MRLPTTEALPSGPTIDVQSPLEAAKLMLDGQSAAIEAVRAASASISNGARKLAAAIRSDNRLHYAAAGSSGLMALADASELRGTFGIPTDKILIHMAGGRAD
ncbi:hypothetical protein [Cognatishimia sp. MH4019]|uniref:hypothetical protein n=1 Tax=Cognatishimia sp. MH4019 TaxID=2854030 RepID=UPI001CD54F9A|nr:hypothetical protein [Cognatishimia sp. MH4019]